MKTYLKTLKNTFLTIYLTSPVTSGRFQPWIASTKTAKIIKYVKIYDFAKIDNFLCGGWKYDFLPDIDPLDPKTYPETPYWPPYVIWFHLRKSQEKSYFWPSKSWGKIFKVDFFSRWASITKLILGIDRPYRCPESPVILVYAPYPFLPICIM